MTTDGDDPNKPCIFPWYYSRDPVPTLYIACDNPDADVKNWCPTEVVNGTYVSGSGKWGYCNEDLSECNIKGGVKGKAGKYRDTVSVEHGS